MHTKTTWSLVKDKPKKINSRDPEYNQAKLGGLESADHYGTKSKVRGDRAYFVNGKAIRKIISTVFTESMLF